MFRFIFRSLLPQSSTNAPEHQETHVINARKLGGKEIVYDRKTSSEAGKWRPPPGCYNKPAVFPDLWAIYAVGTQFFTENVNGIVNFFRGNGNRKKSLKTGRKPECVHNTRDSVLKT
ncbi:hypothetical protein B9Z55_004354 [Caenorhabditis nigoni]|uniref:Uncharacterized protein n=1 Tax=Caenorhabditis nigoni TaxID=1611254 RepID=A0A2G5UWW3_9PELO|nr:hypothetical protein B9Z55_004354 [Caenorhabditis nigoni]